MILVSAGIDLKLVQFHNEPKQHSRPEFEKKLQPEQKYEVG